MKICITSQATYKNGLPRFADCTRLITEEYCRRYDVDFLYHTERAMDDCDVRFDKMARLLDALRSGYDYAIWMDSDAAPIGFRKNIVEYLEHSPRKMQMVKNHTLWHTGVIIVPNTYSSHRLLEEVIKNKSLRSMMGNLYEAYPLNILLKYDYKDLCIEPDYEFGINAFNPQFYKGSKLAFDINKHWCLHLAYTPDSVRDETFYGMAKYLKVME